MGPIKAIQRQPTTSLYLLFGGAILGLFVAKAVPAVRNIFGMAGVDDYRAVPTSDTFPWYLYGSRGTISGLGSYVQGNALKFER
jgi:hypothetical protein